MKMKKISHRHSRNRLRPRDGHKYTKNEMYLSMIILKNIIMGIQFV